MKVGLFLLGLWSGMLIFQSEDADAWGPQGHAAIGQAAVARVNSRTRSWLQAELGAESPAELDRAIAEACAWPDTFREEPDWVWSAPLHYVNIPRDTGHYDRRRDCPRDRCVTQGVKKFAADLGRSGTPARESGPGDHTASWRSFAWLCHLVGDLHQPLHAGYLDDRGGNHVQVKFRGKHLNLHRFWDSALAADRLGRRRPGDIDFWRPSPGPIADACPDIAWRPDLVDCWTDESHALAPSAYPPDPVISETFAYQGWAIIRAQWWKAAGRLALILDAVLAPGTRKAGTAGWRNPGAG